MEGTEARQHLYDENKARLEQLAWRARQQGRTNQDTVIVCIDVDDPTWSTLLGILMPDADWQAVREQRVKPVARGSVPSGITEDLVEIIPDLTDALTGPAPTGLWRTIVFGSAGASVYLVVPHPEPS